MPTIYKARQLKYNTELTVKPTISQEQEDMVSVRITRVYDNASLAVGLTKAEGLELAAVLTDYFRDKA